MAIDTHNERRSIAGSSGLIVAPLADGTIGTHDRLQIAGFYAGLALPVSGEALLFFGDTTTYSGGGATGSISGGTLRTGAPFGGAGATGSISGATLLGEDVRYG